MNDQTTGLIEQRWVAFGPNGAVGSIHHTDHRYVVRMIEGTEDRRAYDSLAVAKSALRAAMRPGSERPEFREH